MIKVVNKYKEPNHMYCGRGSALGNTFPMSSEADRDSVCNQYEVWFKERTMQGMENPQIDMLRKLYKAAKASDINLGCFCAPKRCHCDTIKEFIDSKLGELT